MQARYLTKDAFFSKMSFLLSFYYSQAEASSILEDYNEWFEGEKQSGKTEEQICKDMISPKSVVKKIRAENKSDSPLFSVLCHNPFLQFICLTVIRIFADLFAVNYCSACGLSYLGFVLAINGAYFALALFMAKGRGKLKLFTKAALIVNTAAILFIAVTAYALYNIKLPVGEYLTFALGVAVCLIYTAVIVRCTRLNSGAYLFRVNALGVSSVLLVITNSLHSLSALNSIKYIILTYICIYATVLLLTVLFFALKRERSGQWTHS